MKNNLLLLVGGEPFAFEEELQKHKMGQKMTRLVGSEVMASRLEEELFSPSLFGTTQIVLTEADLLKDRALEVVLAYLKKPRPDITLTMHAAKRTEIAKYMHVVELQDVKPWEKEAHLNDWIRTYFADRKVKASSQVVAYIAKEADGDRQMLANELEKLITYVAERGEVTIVDVKAIMVFASDETLWQLSDAYLQRDTKRAVSVLSSLFEQEMSPFLIVRHLRNCVHQALMMASMHSQGIPNIQENFSQLKGKLFDKTFKIALEAGEQFLTRALVAIDKTEMALKNAPFDENLLLIKLVA